MRKLRMLLLTIAAVAAASVASAHAATVVGQGAIPNPWIGFCGSSLSEEQPFHLLAKGTGSQLPATGSMSVKTVDLYTCAPIQLNATVECFLKLSNNEAVAWGPITSSSEPGFGYNYLEMLVNDGRPSVDTGSINEMYFAEPPGGCADVGYTSAYYQFSYGGATIAP